MSVVFNGVLHFNVRGQMALVLVDSRAHATRKSRSFTEGVHVLYVYLQVDSQIARFVDIPIRRHLDS